jgi:hypothetical protein
MKKLLLFMLLLTQILLPSTERNGGKTDRKQGRDTYSSLITLTKPQYNTSTHNSITLTFYSSYGIHNVMGDPASGKYVVIIEPAKQSLEVRSPGHKSEIIKIESLQPRDVLYYEVSPKKEEGIQSIKELGVTVQVAPSDAEIMIDGESFPHNRTKNLSIGKHRLKIQRKYYVTYHEDIVVSTGTTLFQVELSYDVAMVKVNGGTFLEG